MRLPEVTDIFLKSLLIPAEKRFRLYHFRQPIYLQWSLDRSGLQQCISSIFSFAAQPRRSAARPVRMQTGFLQGLVCLILAETVFENGDLTVVREMSRDAPVIVPADRLSAFSCTPIRRGVFDFSRFFWAEELADKADPVPPESSRVPLSRICGLCVHHFGRSGWQRCPAFPD